MTNTITPAVQNKPYCIEIFTHAHIAFAQSVCHAREGYCFSSDHVPEVFPQTGMARVVMHLGTPEQAIIDAAAVTTAEAIEQQRAAYEREVIEAARLMVDQQKRDEAKKALDAEIEAQTKALRRLKDQAAKV
jgi:glycine/serine hydroxymethyltransferase